jgi:O-antigen ligase
MVSETSWPNTLGLAAKPIFKRSSLMPSMSRVRSPASLTWRAGVFALLVQEGTVISSPALSHVQTTLGSTSPDANIFNTAAVALNILVLAPLCLLYYRRLMAVIYGNKAALALFVLIVISVLWSIHPEVTVRRSVNYLSTLLTAWYLVALFDGDEIMKILSCSIAISVVFSFLFVGAFPHDAIHQASPWHGPGMEDIAGSWKGAFAHKNVLGGTMAVGIFAELYILTTTDRRAFWHFILLCCCFALLGFARSSTASVLTLVYLSGAMIFLVLQRAQQYFGVALSAVVVLLLTTLIIFLAYPDMVLRALGSDPTLTGRTELWAQVAALIWQKPVLGYGYSAVWLPDDSITRAVSNAVGWEVPQAHNALLEVALELGIVGLLTVLAFVAMSLWGSLRCIVAGRYRLGMFSLTFFLGALIAGATEATLVQNQTISWVIFNVLSFSCAGEISRKRSPSGYAPSTGASLAPGSA